MYQALSLIPYEEGPYATIFDFSRVVDTSLSVNAVRALAVAPPAVPAGRTRVVVAGELVLFGFARMVELSRDAMGGEFRVVRSLDEAYTMLGVRPEDFTQRILQKDFAA